MILGFSACGPVQLSAIKGEMSSQVYQGLLQDNVKVSIHLLKFSRSWMVQQ